MLLAVCIISLCIGEYINFITVFCIVVINTGIGCYQEYRATRSVALLEKFLEHTSNVIRDGIKVCVNSKDVVPGDIVLLAAGDYIPADMRFIEAENLLIDESRFSGESLPVEKISETLPGTIENVFHASNIGFSGTRVVEGAARGIIFATGQATFFGKATDLSISSIHETRFFQNIKKISYFLVVMVLVTLIALVVFYLFFKTSTISTVQILMFAVALSVGIVPEALPVITTFSLSQGALLLAKNNVIVKRLASIEDLGGIEILCTDKTGTITENILTIYDVNSFSGDNLIFYMALSGAQLFEKDKRPDSPFDDAAWDKLGAQDFDLLSSYTRKVSIPFDSQHRRGLFVVERAGEITLIVRGDYEEIIKKTNMSALEKESLAHWVYEKAALGCRVIAISKKQIVSPINSLWDQENGMEFIGLVALYDPIKKTVKYTLQKAKELGLMVKIITGDGPAISGHIASEIGLIKNNEDVITGDNFAALSDAEKENAALNISVFSRFLPEQKSELIKILKKRYTVAYLGDGINDVPALKEADVGIAVNFSNDIVKDAADIVLLKKSLKTIIDGIVIGRKIFANIFTYLKTSLTSSIGNFYSIAVASLFLPFLPLLPLQILLINLFSDSPMIAISTDKVSPEEIMSPNRYDLKSFALFTITFGLLSSVFDLVFFHYFYQNNEHVVQTNWFIFNILTELIFIFSARTKVFFIKAIAPSFWLVFFSLLALCLSLFMPFTTIGHTVFLLVTPRYYDIAGMVVIAIAYFMSCEIFKLLYFSYIVPFFGWETRENDERRSVH